MGTPNFKREYTMFMDWKMGNCQSVPPPPTTPRLIYRALKLKSKFQKY